LHLKDTLLVVSGLAESDTSILFVINWIKLKKKTLKPKHLIQVMIISTGIFLTAGFIHWIYIQICPRRKEKGRTSC